MLIVMIEKLWGISRKDGKYRERFTGFKIRRCKIGSLPQIGRNEFYRFAVTEVGEGTAVLKMTSEKKEKHSALERTLCCCFIIIFACRIFENRLLKMVAILCVLILSLGAFFCKKRSNSESGF